MTTQEIVDKWLRYDLQNTSPDGPTAYHLVQLTLSCQGKMQPRVASEVGNPSHTSGRLKLHTSSLNEHSLDPCYPSLGMGFVQKKKVPTVSEQRVSHGRDRVVSYFREIP